MAPPLVLVADGSGSARQAAGAVLGEHGYGVVEAEDGPGALATIALRQPDAVLLDMETPGLDGMAVLDRLRGDPAVCHIPVIVLTTHAEPTEVAAALERGAHDHLAKPFAPSELAARVAAALRTAELLDRLNRRNAELDLFASKAAHDLKSPLTVIKGSADILRIGWDRLPAATRDEQLAAISRAAQRAAAMVDDLLVLARFDAVEAAEAGVTQTRAALAAVIAAAPLNPADEIAVKGTFKPVAVPEADFTAAAANLVENAHHYGRSPDGTLTLTITGRVQRREAVIEVTDRGPGIPTEDQIQIFDAFYRRRGSRDANPASTGVGLTIVRRAVERWGGQVGVRPASPTGATFILVLPVAASSSAPA